MRNRGLRNPGLSALICVALAIGGALSIWSGASEMNALGYETTWTAVKIAFGILACTFGALLPFNFIWGMRVIGALKRGEGVIARWTVPPAAFDEFRASDRALKGTAEDNDYKVPHVTPPAGVEVLFSADGVLIGDTYFGLATTGLGRFRAVRLRPSPPASLEFATILTTAVAQPHARIYNTPGVLRVPVSYNAKDEAAKVLRHYEDVIARRTIVKPHFWHTRIKIGLIVAAVSAVTAALGLSLAEMNEDLANAPMIMMIAGIIFAIAGLVLALLAWLFAKRQHGG
jgi:protein-S-isoprenylcysteine O-methyltransferase Ste14